LTGTVRRRSNGDWEYRFDAGPDPLTGRRRRPGKSGFKTRKEAAKALRKAITAAEQGRSVRASSRTVTAFLDEWLTAIEASCPPATCAEHVDRPGRR